MVAWTVEKGLHGGWDVARWEDGRRVTTRARFEGMSCIGARVLAAELNDAYRLGREHAREEVYGSILSD